jgi:hypothetical protein
MGGVFWAVIPRKRVMFALTCPNCRINSYSSNEEIFDVCIHCGFKFSQKYGLEKRLDERIKQEVPFSLFSCEQQFEARTLDLSERGLSIEITGKPQISVSDQMDFSIGDRRIKAKVMWVNKSSSRIRVGLQRQN